MPKYETNPNRNPIPNLTNERTSSSWVRVGMAREKKGPLLDSERLVVRGAEESFLGADIRRQDLNVNL